MNAFVSWMSWMVRGAAAVHMFNEYIKEYQNCYGPSMYPTITINDVVLTVSKWYRRGRGCEIGDIVSISNPNVPKVLLAKRIIGMPEDIVCVDPIDRPNDFIKVPKGHVWVVGDNLRASRDSRFYGPIPMALIQGKAVNSHRVPMNMNIF